MVRLGGYGDRKPAQLSGGQRQRVALARAIVNRPQVLLLDEPLGALDLKLRQEMQIELKPIQQEVGITFVYVTHDQEEALTMSDRIAVFNHGPDRADRPAGGGLRASRRASSSPGFVGVSNVHRARRAPLHGPAGEDPRARRRATQPEPGAHVEEGVVRDVAVRRAGDAVPRRRSTEVASCRCCAQNLEEGSSEVLECEGPPGAARSGARSTSR